MNKAVSEVSDQMFVYTPFVLFVLLSSTLSSLPFLLLVSFCASF